MRRLRRESNRAGLGAAFVAAISQAVSLAAKHPLRYPVMHRNIRRVRARQFPYSVFYVAEARRVVVLSVFHSSRNPLIWQQRESARTPPANFGNFTQAARTGDVA